MGSRVFLSVRNLAAKRLKGGNNENQLGFPWIWKAVGIEIFFLIEHNSNLWYFASTGICDKMLGRDCKERLDIQFIISHRVEKKTIAITSAQKIDHRSSLNAASNVTSDNIWLNGQHISQCQCWWNRELVDDRCMHRRSNTLLNAASYDLGSIILDIVYSNFKKNMFHLFLSICTFLLICWSDLNIQAENIESNDLFQHCLQEVKGVLAGNVLIEFAIGLKVPPVQKGIGGGGGAAVHQCKI